VSVLAHRFAPLAAAAGEYAHPPGLVRIVSLLRRIPGTDREWREDRSRKRCNNQSAGGAPLKL